MKMLTNRLNSPAPDDPGPAPGDGRLGAASRGRVCAERRHEVDAEDGPVPGQGLGSAQCAEAQLLGQPSYGYFHLPGAAQPGGDHAQRQPRVQPGAREPLPASERAVPEEEPHPQPGRALPPEGPAAAAGAVAGREPLLWRQPPPLPHDGAAQPAQPAQAGQPSCDGGRADPRADGGSRDHLCPRQRGRGRPRAALRPPLPGLGPGPTALPGGAGCPGPARPEGPCRGPAAPLVTEGRREQSQEQERPDGRPAAAAGAGHRGPGHRPAGRGQPAAGAARAGAAGGRRVTAE